MRNVKGKKEKYTGTVVGGGATNRPGGTVK
jgi:hypothetical protein